MFSSVWRRSYHWKNLRPNSKYRGWFNNNGLVKSGYPTSIVNREVGVDENLQERLDDLYKDERQKLSSREDIGFPPIKSNDPTTDRKKMLAWRKEQRQNLALEKASRERTLSVNIGDVEKDHVKYGGVFKDIYDAAELYGIYEDLFPGKIFHPTKMIRVEYGTDDENCLPVHRGNIIKPSQASKKPKVSFPKGENKEGKYYTLTMSTPDGHFEDETKEYLHWMVGNIGEDGSLEELCGYCQPFPPLGVGFFRYVFVLYEHSSKIDYSSFKIEETANFDLKKRTFSSSDFFSKHNEFFTPTSLAFFQSDYDSNTKDFYHNNLGLPEPRYEYEFLPSYVRSWSSMHPRKKSDGFNLFLDRHRDPKEIQEEVLKKKLKESHPFMNFTEQKYPLAHKFKVIGSHPYEGYWFEPSWRRREIERERLRQGIYKDMDWKKLRTDPTDTYA